MSEALRHHVKRIAAIALAAVSIMSLLGNMRDILDGTNLPKADTAAAVDANSDENEVAGLVIACAENDIEKHLAEKGIALAVDIAFSQIDENEYRIESVGIVSKTALSSSTKSEIKAAVIEYLGYDGINIFFTEG